MIKQSKEIFTEELLLKFRPAEFAKLGFTSLKELHRQTEHKIILRDPTAT